jgi:hypothetical protein
MGVLLLKVLLEKNINCNTFVDIAKKIFQIFLYEYYKILPVYVVVVVVVVVPEVVVELGVVVLKEVKRAEYFYSVQKNWNFIHSIIICFSYN